MKRLSYASSGVSLVAKDAALDDMEKALKTTDKRVMNGLSAFASLFDGKFSGYKHPVLVLKMEEPGSKQLLAFQHGRVESICQDMIHHLINDIAVTGASPLAVQDAVICGKLDRKVIARIVRAIASACRNFGCTLVGGETSEQPGVLSPGTYILAASVLGVVEKSAVIDGSKIKPGDTVLAVASNGLHTNGYSLVRTLLKQRPGLKNSRVGKMSFLDAVLLPHVCYFNAIRGLFKDKSLHGMAHITGSGIEGNVERVLPKNVDAQIHLNMVKILSVFKTVRDAGSIADKEMLRTYNMGVGLVIVADKKSAKKIQSHIQKNGHACYPIGEITKGKGKVGFVGKLRW